MIPKIYVILAIPKKYGLKIQNNCMENYIGHNIKHLCNTYNLTQKDFGELFMLKTSRINAYVKTDVTPKIETIIAICDHFNITMEQFILTPLNDSVVACNVAINPTNQLKERDLIVKQVINKIDSKYKKLFLDLEKEQLQLRKELFMLFENQLQYRKELEENNLKKLGNT